MVCKKEEYVVLWGTDCSRYMFNQSHYLRNTIKNVYKYNVYLFVWA